MILVKYLVTLALSLCLISTLTAQQLPQQWLRTFQGQGKCQDRIAAITTDASGNIYVAGYAGSHHGYADAFAMKRNPQGDTIWTYYYDSGTNDYDHATAITVDAAGNTYITGQSENTASNNECFTAKLLPSGAEDWVSRYSPGGFMQSIGNAVIADASGNVYVAGLTEPLSGSSDWLVIKYNASGVQQWVDVLNGPGNGDDEATGLAFAPNGNITVCGYTFNVNAVNSFNAFTKQYTPANGTAWTATWNNAAFNSADKAFGVGHNTTGDVFIGGDTRNSASFNQDMFAVRYDAAGNEIWATIYTDANTTADEYLAEVFVDTSGNITFCGSDFQDGFVTRINNDGSQGWRTEWMGPESGYDIFHGVVVDDAGNAYATGRGIYPGVDYYGNGGASNFIITKFSPLGDSLWSYRCADSVDNVSMAFAITYHDGQVYAGGFVTDTADIDENLYTIIVDTSGSQDTEWSYNGRGDAITMGQFLVTDAADNIYCAATTDRLYAKGYDVSIIKYDPAGTLLWEKYYSSPGWNNDSLTAMQLDPSGNLVLSISTDSSMVTSKYQLSLLKMDQNGNFLDTTWYILTGNNHAKSMDIRNDGSIVLGVNSNINGGMIVFFDAAFNGVWAAKIDSTQFAATRTNVVRYFSNGDIAAGGFYQLSNDSYGLIQRYSSSGTKLWSTPIDSASVPDEVRHIDIDAAGDIAFTGSAGLAASYGTMIGKVDGSNGNLAWRQLYNPATNYEYGVKVSFTPSGNVVSIARGWTGFVSRYYTVQYSGTGNFQWASIYSNTASDREPVDLIVESSNRVVTAGWAINTYSTNYDYVLAGYTSAGAVAFTNTWHSTGPNLSTWDQLNDLARDTQGDFIVTGRSSQEFFNNFLFKMVTIKYGGIPVGISENELHNEKSVLVYPNPSFDGNFNLIDSTSGGFQSGTIYNAQGRLVKIISNGSETFSLHGQPAGLYSLVLRRKDRSIETIRLILNN